MARILYGVHGTGHGHAMRALTVARAFPEHDFLFVSHGDGETLLRREFRVVSCPNPVTPVRGHRVAVGELLKEDLRVWGQYKALMRNLLRIVERFGPDVAMTDYEFFVPRVSRAAGLPCLSLDHQHVVTCCRHRVPLSQIPSYLATAWAIKRLFSRASHHVVTSFYRPSVRPGVSATVHPPLLREQLLRQEPRDEGHVLAYQGYSTFEAFVPYLKAIQRPVVLYGLGGQGSEGNLRFRPPSEEGFLEDLATSSYVVCGGGHTLLSEALYLGKPVLTFPIRGAFEQYLNALYVQRLGYGLLHKGTHPPPGLAASLESKLDAFRERIRSGRFCGNGEILPILSRFLDARELPRAAPAPPGS